MKTANHSSKTNDRAGKYRAWQQQGCDSLFGRVPLVFISVGSEIFVDQPHPMEVELRRSGTLQMTAQHVSPLRGFDFRGNDNYNGVAPLALPKSGMRPNSRSSGIDFSDAARRFHEWKSRPHAHDQIRPNESKLDQFRQKFGAAAKRTGSQMLAKLRQISVIIGKSRLFLKKRTCLRARNCCALLHPIAPYVFRREEKWAAAQHRPTENWQSEPSAEPMPQTCFPGHQCLANLFL